MEPHDQTTRREATLTHTTVEDDVTRAHYRWNTGEISQISVPANFFFRLSGAVEASHYTQSPVATGE